MCLLLDEREERARLSEQELSPLLLEWEGRRPFQKHGSPRNAAESVDLKVYFKLRKKSPYVLKKSD